MNINDFLFYRKNNRYYFESELLEGRIGISFGDGNKHIVYVDIENGSYYKNTIDELIALFNENISTVLGAEAV